jgi:hypothetical protein
MVKVLSLCLKIHLLSLAFSPITTPGFNYFKIIEPDNYYLNMMLLIKKFNYTLICFFIFLFACNSQQKSLDSCREAIISAEKDFKNVNEKDWARLELLVLNLGKDIRKHDNNYNEEQLNEANLLLGRYKALLIKKSASEIKTYIKDAGEQLKGLFDALADTTASDF